MTSKRIGVIGGGPMGLIMIKALLEENLEPVCYEMTKYVGGLWRYHEEDIEGLASVMKSTTINNSKEIGALSDFPPPPEASNYMHNREVYEYLRSYAEKFDVLKHVNLNCEVKKVEPAEDYEITGRLKVRIRNTKSDEYFEEVFDGVVVCIGHHVYPNMPHFDGMENFNGKILHSRSLKRVKNFEDQIVVVVGIGNSALDAAVETSSVARQVYLSTRKGAWVVPRVGPWGIPFDVAVLRRWIHFLMQFLPYRFVCWCGEQLVNNNFDHSLYNLKPKHRFLAQHASISDGLPVKLLSGVVKIKKNIKRFVGNGVIFEGDDHVTECDSVILATGYLIKFPFVNPELISVKDNEVRLYKYIFPPHHKHSTLAVAGLVQIVGAGFPCGESQARWIALVLKKKLKLPSRDVMEADITKRRKLNAERYSQSKRHTIQADFISYMDEINEQFGAKPNIFKLLFTDPLLFCAIFFGPSLPYQYRLQGPHPWLGARQAILDSSKRLARPLNKNYYYEWSVSYCVKYFLLCLCLIVIVVSLLR